MSHIVTVKTQLKDPVAIAAACSRLNLAQPVHGTAQLFAGQTATGLLVQLPGWQYPIAINTSTGEIHHDNYQGHWGDEAQLLKFMQIYAVEKCRLEARKQGHVVTETQLQDGSIRIQIQEGT